MRAGLLLTVLAAMVSLASSGSARAAANGRVAVVLLFDGFAPAPHAALLAH